MGNKKGEIRKMNNFYYVVQNENNLEQREYLIGCCLGRPDIAEESILRSVKEWGKSRGYRLALLVQVLPMAPVVNQLFPSYPTEESNLCLEYVLQSMSDQQAGNKGQAAAGLNAVFV